MTSTLRLTTRGGYYVRSLARDLGRATGALAHLRALRRTAIGPWEDPPAGERPVIRGAKLFPWCGSVGIDAGELAALKAFRPIPLRSIEVPDWRLPAGFPDPQAPIRALHEGALVAMLREREGKLAGDPVLRAPL